MGMPQQPAVYNAGVGYPVNDSIDGNLTLVDVYGTGAYGNLVARSVSASIIGLAPSGDTTGATDTAAIQAALNQGGTVQLGPGNFYLTGSPALTIHPDVINSSLRGCGAATVIYVVGASTGIYLHRTTSYGAQFGLPAQQTVGFLRDLVIDGTFATGAAVGIDAGDGWGYDIDLTIVNFTGATQIAANMINRVFWTEKGHFRFNLMNNQNPLVIDSAVSSISHEYCEWHIYLFGQAGQNGIVFQGGVTTGGSSFWIRGNMSKISGTNSGTPPNSAFTGLPLSAVTILGNNGTKYSTIDSSWIHLALEGNPGVVTGDTYPYCWFLATSNQSVFKCAGLVRHSLNGAGGTSGPGSVLNGAEFSFRGLYTGDTAVPTSFPGAPASSTTQTSQPAVPGTGTIQQNYGPDFMVYVTGGTVSAILVNNQNTGATSGGFFVNAGGSIKLNYSAAPTWVWVPAGLTQY